MLAEFQVQTEPDEYNLGLVSVHSLVKSGLGSVHQLAVLIDCVLDIWVKNI